MIAALLLGNACRCDPPPHVTSADNWAEADALFRQEPRWLVTEEGQRSLYWPRFLELRVAR